MRAEGKAGERSETDEGHCKSLIRPTGTFPQGKVERNEQCKDSLASPGGCLRAGGNAGERSETDEGHVNPSSALRAPSPKGRLKETSNAKIL